MVTKGNLDTLQSKRDTIHGCPVVTSINHAEVLLQFKLYCLIRSKKKKGP